MIWPPIIHLILRFLVAGALVSPSSVFGNESPLELRSTSELESRLAAIDTELIQLAHYSLRSGIGAIGYRSDVAGSADRLEWVEILFDQDYPIDEIVLVPCIRRDTENGFQADAFPTAFRIIAGTQNDQIGVVVAEFDQQNQMLPRIAPVVAPLNGVTASWVRIETKSLSRRAFDGNHVFQLAELLVFSGEENLALRRPVRSASLGLDSAGAWSERFIVDGFMPYLMDASQGKQSVAYVSSVSEKPVLTVDLESPELISRIHLHAVDQSDTVPQAYSGDLGIPLHLLIEGANQADFSDRVVLLESLRVGLEYTGPIMMWRIPETFCRYIRISEKHPGNSPQAHRSANRIGFSEIELFSKGRNVAFEKQVQVSGIVMNSGRSLAALTDGHNLYGKILPIRTWLNELASRHVLEAERPLIAAELSQRYIQQKTNLIQVSWLAGVLAAGIGFTILVDRNVRMRQLAELKERFAADLHDELGADLHTIGLLCDLAKDSTASPDRLIRLLDRTRAFSERSGAAVRYCTNMLEAKGLCEDVVEEMKRSSRRLLADLEHSFSCAGEPVLHQLKPRKRIDLFLFHKECLTNILRHSGATIASTQLTADKQKVLLVVTDNGQGLGVSPANRIPPSLKRRARLLGAQITAEQPLGGGLQINLKLKIGKFKFLT
jgi:signal transduction histidine kinase